MYVYADIIGTSIKSRKNSEEKQAWIKYITTIRPYFSLCADQKVLEIAPFIGYHTPGILSFKPKSLTLVELNQSAVDYLRVEHSSTCEVIQDDIFDYLNENREFDVVICCGLLYHLHSPFYLLELIANNVAPKYIYLETFCPQNDAYFCGLYPEEDNTLGARQVKKGRKSTKMRLVIGEQHLITAMTNLDYKLITTNTEMFKPGGAGTAHFYIFEKQ